MILVLVLNGCFLQQAVTILPVMDNANNQILDYKVVRDICANEMMLIKFF